MRKQVLINVESTDMRVAVLEDATLVELFVERFQNQSILSNIYKGRVEGIVPGLKAVFVNIGLERNAFLHFSDVLGEYALPNRGRPERLAPGAGRAEAKGENDGGEDSDEFIPPPILPGSDEDEEGEAAKVARRTPRKTRPLRVGDPILVQVTKETIGSKGPRVTTYVSLPGRYVVLMPFAENTGGISRKIEDPEERRRLRDLLRSIRPQSGAFIIRTAGLDVDDAAILEDHDALDKVWKAIVKKSNRVSAPALVSNEQDILNRLVRDTLRDDIDEILIDSRAEMKNLIKACESMAPTVVDRVHLFQSEKNIFDVFEVEQQFQKALKRKVWLKSGGFVVIDETEAMTAIDVNSGKYVGVEDQDQVILKTNMEACRVVARQLRLRDLGGLVVIDFIDMTNKDHQQQVIRELRSCMKRDNAKFSMTGFSDFGLVEMTRKRVRMSLTHAIFRTCPYCEGVGKILGEAQIWKTLKYALLKELSQGEKGGGVEIAVHSHIRSYLEREVIAELSAIAARFGIQLKIVGKAEFHHEQFEIVRSINSSNDKDKEAASARRRSPVKKENKGLASDPLATG